jgi:hypothetical protein
MPLAHKDIQSSNRFETLQQTPMEPNIRKQEDATKQEDIEPDQSTEENQVNQAN